jgi:vacuolar protein sorting-associated protein 41
VAIAAEVAPDESLESYEDEVDEEDVEDMEPLLKFKRVEGNLLEVFAQDLATCLAVHARHLVRFHANSGMLRENVEWLGVLLQILGTQSGAVHIFDHGGTLKRTIKAHRQRVNDVCVDWSGDYVASCSNDGTVLISHISAPESGVYNYHRPVEAVRLDPQFARSKERPFVSGTVVASLDFAGPVRDVCGIRRCGGRPEVESKVLDVARCQASGCGRPQR